MSSEILIEKLKQSEKELKDIFNEAPVGLALVRNRVLINVNDMFCRMLGYSAEELIGQTTEFCYIDKAEFKRVGKLIYKQISDIGQGNLEVKGLCKDGTIIDVLLSTAYLKNSKMENDIIFTVLDITESKKVKESLMLTQKANDDCADLIFWVHSDGYFGYVNDKSCKDLGYSRKELLSMSVPDVDPGYPSEKFRELWADVKIKKTSLIETQLKTKAGIIFPVEIRLSYVKYDHDEYMFAFARDISERKKVRESLMLTQTAIDRASDSIFWVRPDGSFGYVNDEACKILGYSCEELLSMSVPDIDPIYTPDKIKKIWEELKSKKTVLIESVHKTKSGKVFPVEIRLNHIKYNDQKFIFSFVRDISKRKIADEELRKAHNKLRSEQQALYEKNVALKQVLSFMEKEKADFKSEISSSIEQALMPFIKKLHKNDGNLNHKDIESLEDTVKTIVGHEIDDFNANYAKLTAREMDICELIKESKSSQEIADTLNISVQTIQKHRTSIREKLQLKNKDINLSAYLRTK